MELLCSEGKKLLATTPELAATAATGDDDHDPLIRNGDGHGSENRRNGDNGRSACSAWSARRRDRHVEGGRSSGEPPGKRRRRLPFVTIARASNGLFRVFRRVLSYEGSTNSFDAVDSRWWRARWAEGLYDPANEHDACGVGFIVSIKGERTHDILASGWRFSSI